MLVCVLVCVLCWATCWANAADWQREMREEQQHALRCTVLPYNTVIRRSLDGGDYCPGFWDRLQKAWSLSPQRQPPALFCCSPRRLLEQNNPRATCQACAAAGLGLEAVLKAASVPSAPACDYSFVEGFAPVSEAWLAFQGA